MSHKNGKNDREPRSHRDRIRRGDTRTRKKPRGFERARQPSGDAPAREGRGGFQGPQNDSRRDDRRDEGRGGFKGPRNDRRRDDARRDEGRGGFKGPRNDRRRDDRRDEGRGGFKGPRNDRRRDDRRDEGRGGFKGPRNDRRRDDARRDEGRGGFKGPRNDRRRDDRRGPRQGRNRNPRGQSPSIRPRDNARDVASYILLRVLEEDAFSNMALRSAFRETPMDRRDRAFTTRLTYGALTWVGYLDAILNHMLPRGLESLPPEVRNHLRIAMYQLVKDRDHTPVHAAIDGCVELVGKDAPHLRGLANGVLRNFERKRKGILDEVAQTYRVEARYGLSKALADTLLARVSEDHADDIMREWNGTTPVIIRSRTQNRDALHAQLQERDDVRTRPHHLAPDALYFEGDIRIILRDVPTASIQDAGAQIASSTLPQDVEGLVADACAGLGGKSLHLLDLYPDIDLVSSDIDKRKLRRFNAGDQESRLTRIDGDMTQISGAEKLALHAAANNHEDGYDAILIDAPCSALGTLGRHPEVRWKRGKEDVSELAKTQHKLLKNMAKLVKPGGYLVYIVCTFSEEETLTQVDRFMQAHPDYILAPPTVETADPRIPWDQLTDATQTVSLWPSPHHTDGFFIARFQRKLDALDLIEDA